MLLLVSREQPGKRISCNEKIQLQQTAEWPVRRLMGKYFAAAHDTALTTGSLTFLEETFPANLLSRKVGFTWKCLRPAN